MAWRRFFGSGALRARDAELDRIRSERDSLREILHHLPEGVTVTDTGGRARRMNPAFRQLFGKLLDASDRGVEPTSQAGQLLKELTASVLAGVDSPRGELTLGPPGHRHLSLVASRLPGRDGAGRDGALIVVRDVTEAIRLAESRKDLVANVSHELKTPLTAIRGYAETLEDGAVTKPDTAQRFLRQILNQCGRLEALLGDLLTLSKIESQPSSGQTLETVDVGRLIREVVDVLTSQARAREVTFLLDLEDSPSPVQGDSAELERIFLNLLENAIKYNRLGGNIRVCVARSGEEAVVEVRDSGIGIPPEAKERIFERFYRVDKGRARDEGGTGLGLAIVKHGVHRHGGSLEVESTLGKGSTFTVRLPLAAILPKG